MTIFTVRYIDDLDGSIRAIHVAGRDRKEAVREFRGQVRGQMLSIEGLSPLVHQREGTSPSALWNRR